MPRIFDNISHPLLAALRATLESSNHADFCVGYFNLRGWRALDDLIAGWEPIQGQVCRVLIGMQRPPHDEVKALYQTQDEGQDQLIDNARASRLKLQFAQHLRDQITFGIPTARDEEGLRQLARQLRAGQVVVKLFLPYPLHAKLYLLFRQDVNNPVTGFVGSSNLTLSGLCKQGELNVDVLDHDATDKLSAWFNDRWNERWCIDVSADLAEVIESSWARETLVPPYLIYLNMAYHLSVEARAGLSQFKLPARFEEELFEFQKSAVKIAARHLNRRGGVMIGDVVGLGKTMMATALARMVEDDLNYETLIICPKNLVPMWESYRKEYGLRGMVISLTQVTHASRGLKDLKRYRLVLVDESHNLRNRQGRRYKAIAEYIRQCDARVILLSATPYNKSLTDLSGQLRLFIEEKANLGIRPEHFMRKKGMSDAQFERQYQCPPHSILGMEKSDELDDWRELIRLYMVRRTRSFITQHYTEPDENGRPFLADRQGEKRYFPARRPVSLTFPIDESDAADQYAKLYSVEVVDVINALHLSRYGLGGYADPVALKTASTLERKQIDDLGKAGKRLIGFCRTNLFKRLESSGFSFLQSLERHILRNEIYLYAIGNGLDIPIGPLDAGLLDADRMDEDAEGLHAEQEDLLDGVFEESDEPTASQAEAVYGQYAKDYRKRFKDESEGRAALLGRTEDTGQRMDYQSYRWLHKRIARNTDSRTLIATITPPMVFTEVNSTTLKVIESGISESEMCYWGALSNSFALDWLLRQSVTTMLNMFFIYQLPMPRLTRSDSSFAPIVTRAARLICTMPDSMNWPRQWALLQIPPLQKGGAAKPAGGFAARPTPPNAPACAPNWTVWWPTFTA